MEESIGSTPEDSFLEERRRGIGGSDWGDVLSIEPYGCARRLWYEKRSTLADFPTREPAHLERGHKLEQIVADGAEERLGVKLQRVGRLARREIPEWWIGHPDRMVVASGDRPTGVFEAKTKGPWPFDRLRSKGIGEPESLQLTHYMHLTGWTWALYVCLEPVSWSWYTAEVNLDEATVQNMLVAGEHFWRSVENGPAPERLMPDDKRCQRCEYRITCQGAAFQPKEFARAEGEPEELDDMQLRLMLDDYDRVNAVYEEAERLREEARDKIRLHLGDRPRKVQIDGRGLAVYQTQQQRVDTTALKRELPDIAAKYTKIIVGKMALRIY